MNLINRFFIIGLLALVCSASPLLAQKRIALVIGNSKYTNLQSLSNPTNDSRLMAHTLRKLNFEVVSASDVDFLGMRRAVKKFGQKLRGSGEDAVGLFYYAGHGVQAQGVNYLVPLGAEISDEADFEIETLTASSVLTQMEAAGNTLNLVILDACRNNPFKGKMRSTSRGLARLNAASGSLVAFAAAPGQAAADGNEENSPYTKALVKAMQIPGLSVEQMFKQVRVSVEAQTNKQQTPWEESSLRGNFYFTPYFTPKVLEPQPVAKPVIDRGQGEWATIQNSQSTSVLEAFIDRHPDSIYAGYARLTLKDKLVAAEELKKAKATAAKVASDNAQKQRLASLQKNSNNSIVSTPSLPQYELTKLLQSELTRVGCNPGRIDGQWGTKGRQALARFKRYASLAESFQDISPEMIDAVKQHRARVCPKSASVKARKTRVRKTKTAVDSTAIKTPARRRKKTFIDECSWQIINGAGSAGEVVCVRTPVQ